MPKRVTSCGEYFETLNERFIPEQADGVCATSIPLAKRMNDFLPPGSN